MKPSVYTTAIILGLFTFQPSFAQTVSTGELKKEPAELSEAEKKRVEDTAKLEEPKELKKIDTKIRSADLSGARVTLVNSSVQLNLEGPSECIERVYKLEPTIIPSEYSSDEDFSDSESEDLASHTEKRIMNFGFHGDSEIPSFSACLKKFADSPEISNFSDRRDLSEALPSSALAFVGIANEDGELDESAIKSPSLRKLEKLSGVSETCVNCNQKLLSMMAGLNIKSLLPAQAKATELSLEAYRTKMSEAKSREELASIKKQMNKFKSEYIQKPRFSSEQKAELLGKFADIYESSVAKSDEIARLELVACQQEYFAAAQSGLGSSTSLYPSIACKAASEHANYAQDTFYDLHKMRGLEAGKREKFGLKAVELNSGSFSRLNFIAGMDPMNTEISALIGSPQKYAAAMQASQKSATKACRVVISNRAHERCAAAQQGHYNYAMELNKLATRYIAASKERDSQMQTANLGQSSPTNSNLGTFDANRLYNSNTNNNPAANPNQRPFGYQHNYDSLYQLNFHNMNFQPNSGGNSNSNNFAIPLQGSNVNPSASNSWNNGWNS